MHLVRLRHCAVLSILVFGASCSGSVSNEQPNPQGQDPTPCCSDGGASDAGTQLSDAGVVSDGGNTSTDGGLGYPFGSHLTPYVAGAKPSSAQADQDAAVARIYDAWKGTLDSRCGGYFVKFSGSFAAVSEGTGYGMLLAVVMAGHDPDAQAIFDGLFSFARSHPAYAMDPALMEWAINSDCSGGGDGYNAMDGDLDIAMALLMADKQWGSAGAVNYRSEALATIAALKAKNMNAAGYTMGGPAADLSRTSDYMITHFKAFKRATGDAFWDTAVNKSFELLTLMQANYSPNHGLVPDFIVGLPDNPAPSPGNRIESPTEGFYAWNACRDPWRLSSDYVTSGDTRSRDVAIKIMDFLRSASGGVPSQIAPGYQLDGTPLASYESLSFIGPATAGALVDPSHQAFLDDLWTYSSAQLAGGYYDNELQLLSLVVASGNWWNP